MRLLHTKIALKWAGNLSILSLVLLITSNCLAQGNVGLQTGIVVLKDGRVFSGTLRQVAGGYRVESSGGYVILPFDEVHLTAESLVGAYESMRDATIKPSTDQHMKLAEWCLENGLNQQARTEITWALKLEPLRTEARMLLAKIDADAEAETVTPHQPALSADGFRRPDERTDSGISRESHQEFIRKVQPLIMNKCGNSGCHGSTATNNFMISSARRTSQSITSTEENLSAVLGFIDARTPTQSPLLLKPSEATRHHKKMFLGAAGRLQYQTLSNWVNEVAQNDPSNRHFGNNVSEQSRAEQPTLNTPVVQTAAGQPVLKDKEPSGTIRQVTGEADNNFNSKALLQQIRHQQKPDAFDPELFNKKMHGATAQELQQK